MAPPAALLCGNPAAAGVCTASGRRTAMPGAAPVRAGPRRGSLAAAHAFTSPLAAAKVQPMPDPFPGLQPGDDLALEYGEPGPNPPKRRRAGVVLHPTSLPGKYGMGEIGGEALRFVDWLAEAGMQLWQVGGVPSPGVGGVAPLRASPAQAGQKPGAAAHVITGECLPESRGQQHLRAAAQS